MRQLLQDVAEATLLVAAIIVAVWFIARAIPDEAKKIATPPQEPPAPSVRLLYLRPILIDRTKTVTVEITKDRACEPSVRFSPGLKCLDDNGDVILP